MRDYWLTILDDSSGEPMPEGFAGPSREDLLLAALHSLGYEARFTDRQPTQGASDDYVLVDTERGEDS